MLNPTTGSPNPTSGTRPVNPPGTPLQYRPRPVATAADAAAAERACRLANLAWHWTVTRSGYRSHVARLRAMQAAGAIPDETYFARLVVR